MITTVISFPDNVYRIEILGLAQYYNPRIFNIFEDEIHNYTNLIGIEKDFLISCLTSNYKTLNRDGIIVFKSFKNKSEVLGEIYYFVNSIYCRRDIWNISIFHEKNIYLELEYSIEKKLSIIKEKSSGEENDFISKYIDELNYKLEYYYLDPYFKPKYNYTYSEFSDTKIKNENWSELYFNK